MGVERERRRDQDAARALGEAVRTARRKAAVGRSLLAERACTHANYIGALECGRVPNPGIRVITRIAHGLGASSEYFARAFGSADLRLAREIMRACDYHYEPTHGPAQDAIALGIALRAARGEVTLSAAADDAGLNRRHLSNLERGRIPNPGVATLRRVAFALRPAPKHGVLSVFFRIYAGEPLSDAELSEYGFRSSGSSHASPSPDSL